MEASTRGRDASLDALRGFIMVTMALDHAAYFVGRRHPAEFWGLALPDYGDWGWFLTRWVTHLSAPGFFLLLGAGVVLYGRSREARDWSINRIRTTLLQRGALLILINHFLENPAWILGTLVPDASLFHYDLAPPGSAGTPFLAFGVLTTLGVALVVCGLLLRTATWVLAAGAAGLLVVSWASVPEAAQVSVAFAPWTRMLFVPGQTGPLMALYPIVPWVAVAMLGMVLARVADGVRRPGRLYGGAAVLLLASFVLIRGFGGYGNLHPVGDGLMGFLAVTKYPPSAAFLTLTLGINLAVLALFATGRLKAPEWLLTLGRAALFFYVAHIWLFTALGLVWQRPAGITVVWMSWVLGVAALVPASRAFRRFKEGKEPESPWRLV